jgi:hypothetical protein
MLPCVHGDLESVHFALQPLVSKRRVMEDVRLRKQASCIDANRQKGGMRIAVFSAEEEVVKDARLRKT